MGKTYPSQGYLGGKKVKTSLVFVDLFSKVERLLKGKT